jgi:signal transduction histidine kinase
MTAATRRSIALTGLRLCVAAGCYVAAALVFRYALGRTGEPGLVPVVIATAVVAVLLHLLADPLEHIADRITYGSAAEEQSVVRGLLRRMASTLPVDEVAPMLAEMAGRTVGGPRAEVRLTLSDGQQWSQVWPTNSSVGESALAVGVLHGGAEVGEITVDVDPSDTGVNGRRLLDDLAAPAGLALNTVRLTLELRQRIAELDRANAALRASTARLRTARVDEQNRLQREVHDRVMRNLDDVDRALTILSLDPTSHEVDAARSGCERALDELRFIARGIFPPRLAEAGLLVSIEGWLERARLHADLEAGDELVFLHSSAELAACAYFCAVTALDALAAAGGSDLRACVDEIAGQLRLTVTGSGATSIAAGDLAVLRDRIEAFDGALVVESSTLAFTAPLAVEVPVGAPS